MKGKLRFKKCPNCGLFMFKIPSVEGIQWWKCSCCKETLMTRDTPVDEPAPASRGGNVSREAIQEIEMLQKQVRQLVRQRDEAVAALKRLKFWVAVNVPTLNPKFFGETMEELKAANQVLAQYQKQAPEAATSEGAKEESN